MLFGLTRCWRSSCDKAAGRCRTPERNRTGDRATNQGGGGGDGGEGGFGACPTRQRLWKCYQALNNNVIPFPREKENDMVAEGSIKQGASGEMRCRRRGRSDVSTKQRQRGPGQPASAECRVQTALWFDLRRSQPPGHRSWREKRSRARADSPTALALTVQPVPSATGPPKSESPGRLFFPRPPPWNPPHFKQHRPDYEIIPPRRAAPRWQLDRGCRPPLARTVKGCCAKGRSGLRLRPSLSSPKKH